jgi:hypothetical protein
MPRIMRPVASHQVTSATLVLTSSSPATGVSGEPWHGLWRQMDTGGLQCRDLIQRCQALFGLAALCVLGSPNPPDPRGCITCIPFSRPPFLPIERPRCPKCQNRIMLARISPGPAGYAFECAKRNHAPAVTVAHDPMKSGTTGWITGELKPQYTLADCGGLA